MDAQGFEDIGNRLTTALLTGDFDLYRSLMRLPLRIEGGPDHYDLTDTVSLWQDFRLYHDVLRLHGVTDIDREVLDMRDAEGGRIDVTCRVNIVARAQRIVQPFRTDTLVAPAGASWLIERISSSSGHIDWTRGNAAIDTAGNFVRR